jgi:hypothetical protein
MRRGLMAYVAKTSTAGMWTNPVKVTCSGCGASNLYVQPDKAKDAGSWECPHCHKRH